MKRVLLTGVMVLGLGAGLWSCAASKARPAVKAQPLAVADFRITIERTATGAKLECLQGCAWKTLTFPCDALNSCKTGIDGMGMVQKTPAEAK